MGRFDVLKKDQPVQRQKTTRRNNPGYRQFSAYIPADLYRRVKMSIADKDVDLSEAVEKALEMWLKRE